jgi:hypothetical protein
VFKRFFNRSLTLGKHFLKTSLHGAQNVTARKVGAQNVTAHGQKAVRNGEN